MNAVIGWKFTNGSKRGGRSSTDTVAFVCCFEIADGTIDIFFGPKAKAGQEANSVPTNSDINYWWYFRFYGPKPAVFTKTWHLPDLVEVK